MECGVGTKYYYI